MTLLAMLALDQAKDVVFWGLFQKSRKFINAEKDCRVWRQHKRIPVLGWFVARAARQAKPSKMVRTCQPKLVSGARWFVNTKTFEDVVTIVTGKMQVARESKTTAVQIPKIRLTY